MSHSAQICATFTGFDDIPLFLFAIRTFGASCAFLALSVKPSPCKPNILSFCKTSVCSFTSLSASTASSRWKPCRWGCKVLSWNNISCNELRAQFDAGSFFAQLETSEMMLFDREAWIFQAPLCMQYASSFHHASWIFVQKAVLVHTPAFHELKFFVWNAVQLLQKSFPFWSLSSNFYCTK